VRAAPLTSRSHVVIDQGLGHRRAPEGIDSCRQVIAVVRRSGRFDCAISRTLRVVAGFPNGEQCCACKEKHTFRRC